ncbi:MAG: DUF2141 domain-containing protein [Chitinivibrionales bacterium]|nr:DUF2141 domain-containing protein [Chitinivibrionales bacterium]
MGPALWAESLHFAVINHEVFCLVCPRTRPGDVLVVRAVFICICIVAMAAFADARKPGEPLAICVEEPGVTVSGIITGYEPGKGIYIALYCSEGDFDSGRYCRNLRFVGDELPADTIRYAFENLPTGEYLVACYQDVDGDGAITRGLFGMPKDPYRIYRPNYGFFGPKFSKCRFRVDSSYTTADMDFTKGKK